MGLHHAQPHPQQNWGDFTINVLEKYRLEIFSHLGDFGLHRVNEVVLPDVAVKSNLKVQCSGTITMSDREQKFQMQFCQFLLECQNEVSVMTFDASS